MTSTPEPHPRPAPAGSGRAAGQSTYGTGSSTDGAGTAGAESAAGRARLRWPWQRWVGTVLGACAAWAAAIWLAMHLMADMTLHHVALFTHLAALVVGFGGVLSTDFQAVMWLMGRRPLTDVIRFGAATHALIWIGLTGLVVSGVLLNPNFSQPLTRLKMVLVLVVMLNGLGALALQHRLDRGTRLTGRLLARATALGMISQLAWWGAIVIGFMNSNDRIPSHARPASVQPSDAGRTGAATRGTTAAVPTRTGSSAGQAAGHTSMSVKRHMRHRPEKTPRPSAMPGPMDR